MSPQVPRDPEKRVSPPEHHDPAPAPPEIPDKVLRPSEMPTQPAATVPHSTSDIESLIGLRLSQYHIIERLGRGGMGVVYKARDTRLSRDVALKFLSPHLLSDSEAKLRFLREARAAAALDDPHICTVHDICEVGDHTFIVMNFVEGGSLKEKLASSTPTVKEALEIARQIGMGLAKAHRQGIIHRDIKPANILLTRDDQVKIADFGLAKLASQTRLTETGAAVGTLAYMSPEQTRGREVDQRADIWSLGVALYEMLTGELPFRGENKGAMTHAVMKSTPRPISDLRPEVSIGLEVLVEKALSKRPGNRYPDVDAFLADLEEQIGISQERASRGLRVRVVRILRRRKTRRGIAVSVSLAVLLCSAWITMRLLPPREMPRIMVASWENATGRKDLDWVSGAVMSGLIRTMGDLEEYNVISRQTVAATVDALRLTSETAPIAYGTAQEVGASYLLSGAFRLAESWLVLDCELTNVGGDGVLVDSWSIGLADSARIHEAVVELAVYAAGALGASWNQDPRTSPPTLPTTSTSALRHYERALAAEERNEFGVAVDELLKAVAYDSTFAEAHFGIARLTMEKDVEQQHYTLAMKYRLRTPPITRKLIEAQGMAWEGKVDSAIEKYEEILQEDPEQVMARKELARLYANRRRFAEALSEYEVLHQISPLDFSFYRDWAMAYVENGRPDRAVDLIQDWRRRLPREDEPLTDFLVLCHRIARYAEGVALCDSLVAVDPEALPYPCGWLFAEVGRLKEAERIFSRLVESPDSMIPSTRGYAYLAWLADRQQNYAQGLGYIEKAIERQDDTWYHWLAGSLAAKGGKLDRAKEHAELIVQLNPGITDTSITEAVGNRRWYLHLLGLIELAEGHPAQAIIRFERVMDYTSRIDDPFFRTHLGRAHLEAGHLNEAERQFKAVLEQSPSFPEALLYLGRTYLLEEDYPRSIEVLQDLDELWAEADPDDPLNRELHRLLALASAHH